MKLKFIYALLSFFLFVFPAVSQAEVFNGDISFSNCDKLCNSAGDRVIKFHSQIDFTLRIVIDEDSFFPVMKIVNLTKEKVKWSFHMVFFDKNESIVAAYGLSHETKSTNEYGSHVSASRISMQPKDMNKINKYKMVVYTY